MGDLAPRRVCPSDGGGGPTREAFPSCRWIGPPIIDFEYYFTTHYLVGERPFDFDGIAALLYVDRRGSPDNVQYGHFDLYRKILLLRAVIQASGHPDIPIYLTEFNWPLKGSGKHSPAGEHVQTDEVDQARFLVLYDLTAAATGQVASTFWWQLVARGYGLLDEDDAWTERRAYRAFKHLLARTRGRESTASPRASARSGASFFSATTKPKPSYTPPARRSASTPPSRFRTPPIWSASSSRRPASPPAPTRSMSRSARPTLRRLWRLSPPGGSERPLHWSVASQPRLTASTACPTGVLVRSHRSAPDQDGSHVLTAIMKIAEHRLLFLAASHQQLDLDISFQRVRHAHHGVQSCRRAWPRHTSTSFPSPPEVPLRYP